MSERQDNPYHFSGQDGDIYYVDPATGKPVVPNLGEAVDSEGRPLVDADGNLIDHETEFVQTEDYEDRRHGAVGGDGEISSPDTEVSDGPVVGF